MTATNYAGNGSALSGKQSTINSTAGQLIIGNGNGSTTTSSSLTFSGTTLTAGNFVGNGSGLTNIPFPGTVGQLYIVGGEWTSTGLYFSTPFAGINAATKSAIIAEAIGSYSRHHLSFCFNNTASNGENVSTANVYLRFHTDGWIGHYKPLYNQSDRRIKRDIEEINDDDALNKILLIKPTTYYYIDETRNKGNDKVYGFIAQQIKEVIPEAVAESPDLISNICKKCFVRNKREIYYSLPNDIEIDTEVQIYDKRYKIKEIYIDYFVIDNNIDSDECFVYGYCVKDAHVLNKSYIYTLNVCATQELHRRIEAQNVVIKSHEDRIKDLEEKVELLLSNVSNASNA